MEREVDQYSKKMDAYWKSKADAYALAGEKVTEDPRRTEAYRDLVWDGLKIAPAPGPTRPGLTEADVAAIREVVRRKAAGFWVEGPRVASSKKRPQLLLRSARGTERQGKDLQATLELVLSRYRCARVLCEGSRAGGASHTGSGLPRGEQHKLLPRPLLACQKPLRMHSCTDDTSTG